MTRTIGTKTMFTKRFKGSVFSGSILADYWFVYAISGEAALKSLKSEYDGAYGSELSGQYDYRIEGKNMEPVWYIGKRPNPNNY